ncbi:glycosyltransferase family 4 protein [Flavicella sediminum]|uniref:glycosyltransferase family 4 protein n=1 Tax=Flavicella sediminum TaxID=2585141 RepID=UPI001122307F|nr:glycosyltransferase family 4 protein [Flavicella sediminum]
MHIGFITPEYPHKKFTASVGGIGTFTKNLAEQLVSNGMKVSVFIPSQSNEFITELNGVEIYFVQRKRFKGLTWLTNRRYFNSYVNKIIKSNKIDVMEAPEWTGFTAFMKFPCPLLIRLHGSDTYFCHLEKRKVKFKNKFFEKRALLGATEIIGVSNFVSQKTKELFSLNKEIKTLYNTINSEDFIPNHKTIEPKTLLYFGTIIRKKGVLEIAKAFNIVVEKDPTVQLCLLGRDCIDVLAKKSTLKLFNELLSVEAKRNFKHIAAVPYAQVKEHICKAEIILLPSFAEAFPMTWLEAMALEKKMVTSNIGWAKELMIDGETGYMVNPTNSEEFAHKIINLLMQKEVAGIMGKNARAHLKRHFDAKKILNENINLYKNCIQNEI